MDWTALTSSERLGDGSYRGSLDRSIFVQDHDRIVFSAPFRRLANKTQVQPLYEHDHVHHRLIHSIEVSSVGRSLTMAAGNRLAEAGHLPPDLVASLANIVQAACVAHDIGNPPYGHSGEAAIGDWFAERFAAPRGLMADLDPELIPEFTAFEGNAQGFRILTRLEMYRNAGGMRLSKATLGAFTKYPVDATTRARIAPGAAPYVGLKKFGIFRAERELFETTAETLGLPREGVPGAWWWRRHPLVFLVEAADDICYNIVDLEDAVTTGELPVALVREVLEEAIGTPVDAAGRTDAELVGYLRARAIGQAVDSVARAFETHYAAIMDGSYSGSLIEGSDIAPAFARMRQLAGERVFTAPRKTELEISGRQVISNVMSGLLPVYEELAAKGWQPERLGTHAAKLVRALDLDLRDIDTPGAALHGLADFTSGMTDRYALRISRMLSGI